MTEPPVDHQAAGGFSSQSLRSVSGARRTNICVK